MSSRAFERVFTTSIYLQKSASTKPRMSRLIFSTLVVARQQREGICMQMRLSKWSRRREPDRWMLPNVFPTSLFMISYFLPLHDTWRFAAAWKIRCARLNQSLKDSVVFLQCSKINSKMSDEGVSFMLHSFIYTLPCLFWRNWVLFSN